MTTDIAPRPIASAPVAGWPLTVWTQARQVTKFLGWPAMPGDDAAPYAFFAALRAGSREVEAAQFLGLSLPRYEAVAWAARVLAAYPVSDRANVEAMRAVHRWLLEPTDALRRAAMVATYPLRGASPARLCATAVFLSGGSTMPAGATPTPAPRHTTGMLAAAAILAATSQSDRPAVDLAEALDLGAAIAAQHTEPL
jgi:hypothetical protein